MCTCMLMCICIRICIYIYIYMYLLMLMSMLICVYRYMYMCMHVYLYTYTYMHMCMYISIITCVCICVSMYVDSSPQWWPIFPPARQALWCEAHIRGQRSFLNHCFVLMIVMNLGSPALPSWKGNLADCPPGRPPGHVGIL